MCCEANFIQELWLPSNGDYYFLNLKNNKKKFSHNSNSINKQCCIWRGSNYKKRLLFDLHLYGLIWLPRQDQLIRLIFSNIELSSNALNKKKSSFISKTISILEFSHANNRFKSNEQLLLSFIMKDKHNNTWTGDSWSSYSPPLFKYNKIFRKMLKQENSL